MPDDPHPTWHPSLGPLPDSHARLRLVDDTDIAPGIDGPGLVIAQSRTGPSIADLLSERGSLPESEARGVAGHAAAVLSALHASGSVHGDVSAANIVFDPAGDLCLVGGVEHRTDTPNVTLHADVAGLIVMVIELATSVVIDPAARWDIAALTSLGCSPELSADVAVLLFEQPTAERVGAILQRRDDRLPAPPRHFTGIDLTPTIDIAPVAIAGLSPVGLLVETPPAPARFSWLRGGARGRR